MQTPTLATLANGQQLSSLVAAINSNFQIVANSITNTLDRYGTSPNQYQSTLDMNSNQIINLPTPSTINSPVRVGDLTATTSSLSPSLFGLLAGNNIWTGGNTFTAPNYTANIA